MECSHMSLLPTEYPHYGIQLLGHNWAWIFNTDVLFRGDEKIIKSDWSLSTVVCYLLEIILGCSILILIDKFCSRPGLYSLFLLMITVTIEIAVLQSMESPWYILKFSESLLNTGHRQKTAITDQCVLPALDVERGLRIK